MFHQSISAQGQPQGSPGRLYAASEYFSHDQHVNQAANQNRALADEGGNIQMALTFAVVVVFVVPEACCSLRKCWNPGQPHAPQNRPRGFAVRSLRFTLLGGMKNRQGRDEDNEGQEGLLQAAKAA